MRNHIMKIVSNATLLNIKSTERVDEGLVDDFESRMGQKREVKDIKQKLKGLLERIDLQASKLEKRLSIEDLKEYKKLVSEFMNEAISHSYQFNKERILDHRGRHRVFGLIKKINEELETLTKEVLKTEKSRIGILAKLDDIRGMLIDIAG